MEKLYIVEPDSKKITFPKIKHDKQFVIKLKQDTDFAEVRKEYRYQLKEYGEIQAKELESEIDSSTCFEVEPLSAIAKANKDLLAPYEFIKGKKEIIENFISIIEDSEGDEIFVINENDAFEKSLLKGAYLIKHEFNSYESQKKEYLDGLTSFTKDILQALSKKHGLKVSLKKQELVDQLLKISDQLEIPQFYRYDIGKLKELLAHLSKVYINDIKENSKRYHPIYHRAIWEGVAQDAGYDFVSELVSQLEKEADLQIEKRHRIIEKEETDRFDQLEREARKETNNKFVYIGIAILVIVALIYLF